MAICVNASTAREALLAGEQGYCGEYSSVSGVDSVL